MRPVECGGRACGLVDRRGIDDRGAERGRWMVLSAASRPSEAEWPARPGRDGER